MVSPGIEAAVSSAYGAPYQVAKNSHSRYAASGKTDGPAGFGYRGHRTFLRIRRRRGRSLRVPRELSGAEIQAKKRSALVANVMKRLARVLPLTIFLLLIA